MAEIKEGYYRGRVLDSGFGPKDGEEGTPYLAVKFELSNLEGTENDVIGALTGYFYLSDKALDGTAKKLRAIGYVGNNSEELADGTKLRGMTCQVQVTPEVYEGKMRNKIGWVNPIDFVPGVVKGEASAKANARRLDTLLKTVKPTAKDDIPF